MKENFDIKYKDHFKLYVELKDKIIFESELMNHGIQFYFDIMEQSTLTRGVRYFLLDKDRRSIDEILISKGIAASTETIAVGYVRDGQKLAILFVIVILMISAIALILAIIIG